MKNTLLAIALTALFSLTARADEDSHRSLAENLLKLMNVEKSTQQSFEMVKEMQINQFKKMGLNKNGDGNTPPGFNEIMDMIANEMGWRSCP